MAQVTSPDLLIIILIRIIRVLLLLLLVHYSQPRDELPRTSGKVTSPERVSLKLCTNLLDKTSIGLKHPETNYKTPLMVWYTSLGHIFLRA